MRYQPRRERDRIADNLDAALRKLRREGKEGTEEYKRVQEWLSETRYGGGSVSTSIGGIKQSCGL